jgi:hypothetical protein
MPNSYVYVYLLCISVLFLFPNDWSEAQQRFQFSVYPAYHAVNTDEISADPKVSQTNWTFGGTAAVRSHLHGIPLELSIGFSYGQATVREAINTLNQFQSYSIDLRYRSVPAEILLITRLGDGFDLATGINLTAQDRTLIFRLAGPASNIRDLRDDRLFSFGLGLSGRLYADLYRFRSGNGSVFANVSVRWTEYVFHDNQNRNLDDFTLRHVTVGLHAGVAFQLR